MGMRLTVRAPVLSAVMPPPTCSLQSAPDSIQVEVAVFKKDSLTPENLMPTEVQNIIAEFAETNKNSFCSLN